MLILPLSLSEFADAKDLEAARRKFHEKVKRMRLETLRDPVADLSARQGGDYALRLLSATGDLCQGRSKTRPVGRRESRPVHRVDGP